MYFNYIFRNFVKFVKKNLSQHNFPNNIAARAR